MDIVVKTVLDFVQSIEGCENSVIAGGSVRDYLLKSKVPSRDYDIFVPDLGEQNNEMFKLIHEKFLEKEEKPDIKSTKQSWDLNTISVRKYKIASIGDFRYKSEYPESHFQVSKFRFEDKDFDFIVRKDVPNDETFADSLIDTFNFGINMCYYDGISITTNEKFDNDHKNHCCTLWNTEVDGQSLLKTLEKYDALSKKFGLRFENKCLTKKEIINGN